MVKSLGGKRESDGVVVPLIAGRNPAGGKGPDFGHAGERGTRKGMAGTAQPNYPEGRHLAPDNVRRLQNRRWAAAKQSPGRRFHALCDRICRDDVLAEAWERVRANRGAAGVDGWTLKAVEDYGAQQAAKLVLEPVFEAGFLPCSHGFRPRRSAFDASERTRVGFIEGSHFVFEADIQDFFGSNDHDRLLSLVAERVSERRVLKLFRAFLRAGVLADGVASETVTGTPQGGVISPLLANIYLHAFDRAWAEHGVGEVVRYADDFVVLCRTEEEAEQARERAAALLGELGLTLHPDKTRTVDLREGGEGFDFLGCHFRARMSGKLWEQKRIVRYYLHRWTSLRSMKRARAKVHALTDRSQVGQELEVVIGRLNQFLRGWGNYCRSGNASRKLRQLDRYVVWRLRGLLVKKRGRNPHAGQADRWTEAWFHGEGLHKLMGTIRYPKAA